MVQPDSNRATYEQWVRSYASELYRYAYRMTGRHQIAEDLLQETFMEAWRFIDKQRDRSRARAWLFQILRYRHAHYRRDNAKDRQTVALTENAGDHPPDNAQPPLERLSEQDAMQIALGSLSPILRQTFLMVFSQGLTCRETSQTLGVPIGTVLSRLDSARKSLRVALAEHRPADDLRNQQTQ
jgi:RNA polymerase sigma-70 factor (ECF subfamily)